MTSTFVGLISAYGPVCLAVMVALGCIGLPLPTSLALVVAGGLIASGDLSAPAVLIAALGGAVVGDTLGYLIGRLVGPRTDNDAAGSPERQKANDRAAQLLSTWGGTAVFFTRWLLPPLGPALNIAAGAARLNPTLFFFGDIAGQMVWVFLFVFTGYLLASQVAIFLPLISATATLAVAAAATLILGFILIRKLRREPS